MSQYSITYINLLNGSTLPDGDVIAVTPTPAMIDPGKIGIGLMLSGVTWWKGIQSNSLVLCQCQDGQAYAATQFNLQDFKNGGLQLWKAKTFGVHENTYDVSDATTAMEGGYSYLFSWKHD